MGSDLKIAYIAESKLYLQEGQRPSELHESAWVQELVDRAERSRERNSWKDEGLAWNMHAGGTMTRMLTQYRPAEVRNVEFAGVCRGRHEAELFYAINTDHVGGLFELEFPGAYEKRLVHRNELRSSDLALHPADGVLAVAMRNADGTSHIGLMDVERRGLRAVTEGDVVDEGPAWNLSRPKTLVYQSAGIARDQHGMYRAMGAYAIHELDLAASAHKTLLEDARYDYLQPRVDAQGRLLCIRRPYVGMPTVSLWKMIEDSLLFPFRVVRMIVHLLHFMSLMFSGKPLISAGGPRQDGPTPGQVMLFGRLVQAQKMMRNGAMPEGQSLVPADWQLVRQESDGALTTLASHVVCFDLAEDGRIIYSDGGAIYELAGDGRKHRIGTGALIRKVAVVGQQS